LSEVSPPVTQLADTNGLGCSGGVLKVRGTPAFLSRAVSEIGGHLPRAVTGLKDEGGSYHMKPRKDALCCIKPGLAQFGRAG